MTDKTQKIVLTSDAKKGAAAPKVTVVQNVPLREGARAPVVASPVTVPKTDGPISVTKPKE